ncbi:hypothetical protein JZO76_02895 [Enterococcus sp. MJM12]|uniref:DNA-directed RNA polymerase beta subunit n=1 Tax=Candidatus Enterococcus myersii TaxID=2815322 RepID=A0ABS3H4X6_9ENTE|nr:MULTISPECIES: hypothetical protein [Enterococcus]MBO0448474.1 hypothetical protein [Enterococcus sp. MJM12]MDT2740608.1 hypothetical protein [Enterococcus canintestini]
MRIPPSYQDRKLLKWNGFYLSEHTRQMAETKAAQAFLWPAKPIMDKEAIAQVLYEARLKERSIALQKEEVDAEGHYFPDIVGKIQGYDELGIYIANQKIDYDEIRSVTFTTVAKWSALEE